MIKIGQIAHLFGITSRTLRHYDAIGLFSPALLDPTNGYRLYRAEQIDELARILLLRQLQVPLETIGALRKRNVLKEDPAFVNFLLQHRQALAEEIHQRTLLLETLNHLVASIEKGNAVKPDIDIIDLPAFEVAGLPLQCGDASGIPGLWSELRQKLSSRGRLGSDWIGYGLCEATDSGHFTYIAAISLSKGEAIPEGLQRFSVPARRYAHFSHSGPLSTLAETSRQVWRHLESDWGLCPAEGPELERYGDRFQDNPDQIGIIDGFIPVARP